MIFPGSTSRRLATIPHTIISSSDISEACPRAISFSREMKSTLPFDLCRGRERRRSSGTQYPGSRRDIDDLISLGLIPDSQSMVMKASGVEAWFKRSAKSLIPRVPAKTSSTSFRSTMTFEHAMASAREAGVRGPSASKCLCKMGVLSVK